MALIAPHSAPARNSGFTVVEIVIVLMIVMILTASVLGGYANMQQSQRLVASTDKMLSTIHLARSLAISNNAVYHIRIEDYEVVNATTTPVTAKLIKDNYVSVYAYARSSDSIRVLEEPHPLSADWWNNSFSLLDKNNAPLVNTYPTPPKPYNNRCIERQKLEMHSYAGVQDPVKEVEKGAVLSFYPDGTASQNITFFLTSDDAVLYDDTGKAFQARDDKSLPLLERQKIADLRRNAVNGNKHADGSSYGDAGKIRVIKVLKGGLVKLLKKEQL